ncbi:RNA polymerase sigma factor [Gemmata massiliana]|uniref:RNA polymerase sigma factor n=1 Tax=Gemmata massiliana TaxID=1210884 RepID=UPI0013A6885B|nr:RNA polymerase sigma factor [Gemmata massiliana]
MDSVNRGGTGRLWGAFTAARERAEPDADLLGRFVRTRDEAAFRELVRRLGPTVFGVCCRYLGNSADADDAFQTTFLVLARKAGTVRPPGRVAAWVYGVACLAARKLRQTRQRRQLREVAVPHPPDRPAPEGEMDTELRPAVDEELGRLPDNFRLPIVLCGLRGLTIAQAAAELGWPVGTVATRLSRGRAELAKRLARRGITLAAIAAVGGWSELVAGVPLRLIEQTVATATGGSVPPAVTALTSEVVNAMTWAPLRQLGLGLLVASAVALAGGAIISNGIAAPVPNAPIPDAKPTPGDTKPALDRVEWNMVAGLLRQASVRKEIGLSPDDYKTLVEFRKERRVALKKRLEAGFQAGGQQNGGGVQKARGQQNGGGPGDLAAAEALDQYLKGQRELEVEVAKKAAEVLSPAGVKRLKQAVLQAAGPRGLLDRVAIRELQLTAEQEDRIVAALGPVRSPLNVIQNARLERTAQEQDAVLETALKVLTADQRKRWEALVGKPLPTADLLRANPTSEESMADLSGE